MRRLLMRLSALVRRRQFDAELSEELAAHLDEAIADNIASGMSPHDAHRAALLKFGGTMQTIEAYRDREGWPLVEHAVQDLRYAVRRLATRPMLLVTTTLSIGFGVGLNVAVFALLRAVLFEPGRTARAPEELFLVLPGLSYPNYVDIRATDAFADLAAMQSSTLTYRTADTTRTIGASVVSDNYFEVLGLHALYGRTFGAADGPGVIKDANVVVISYAFWRRLGGDQTVIGRTIYLNGWPYAVSGVLPRDAHSMVAPMVAPAVYVQLGSRVNRALDSRDAAQFDVVGRLRGNASREQTAVALTVIARDLEQRYPDANEAMSRTLRLARYGGLVAHLPAGGGRIAYTLAGALYAVVGLVLLVACANVAGLLLARAAERDREVSIRIALGATRWRLAQQFVAESLVIASLGCAAGAALWVALTTLLPKLSLIANAGVELIAPPLSLTQCGLLVVVVTIACGIGPALTVNQRSPGGHRRSIARRPFARWSFGQWLVAAQVAISFIVLAG